MCIRDRYAEWAKHAAWRARNRLDNMLQTMEFNSDRIAVAAQLDDAIADVRKAVEEMSDLEEHQMHHYEKS